ncbi:response regulator transcription factor [Shewanella sp. 125m-7]
MSTAFIQIHNNTKLDSSSSRMFELQQELHKTAECFGFIGATYFINLSENISIKDSLLAKPINPSLRTKWDNFIFSSPKMKTLRQEFASKSIKSDPNISKIKHHDHAVFCYKGDGEDVISCRKTLDKYGIKSRLYFRFTCDDYPEFSAHILLMSSLSSEQLALYVEKYGPKLRNTLQSFHQMVFCSRITADINPIVGLGLVSIKGKAVLELVAKGYSRTEISKTLFLTERGVDYHVNKLKTLLNARNNAHLIRESFRLKILS